MGLSFGACVSNPTVCLVFLGFRPWSHEGSVPGSATAVPIPLKLHWRLLSKQTLDLTTQRVAACGSIGRTKPYVLKVVCEAERLLKLPSAYHFCRTSLRP